MPATRSGTSSKQSRAPSTPTRLSRKASTTLADEVISIGSSEGSSSAMFAHLSPSFADGHISSPSRAKSVSSRRPVNVSSEVIEISSDEDEPAVPRRAGASSGSAASDMRRQIRKLKEEKERYRHEAQMLSKQLDLQRQKVRTLEIQTSLEGRKVGLNESELDDIISCAVCTDTMFTPYIISGCGHTFCQTCLTDWFDATLRNFMTNHPHYNPNQLYQPAMAQTIAQLLNNPHTMLDPRVMQFIQANTLPRPQYTCPGCRSAVKSPPIENFSMKSLSRMVTAAKKEPIPSVPLRPRNGLWDGYFPPALRR